MRVPRRAPRAVYREYDEHAYLSGAEHREAAHDTLAPRDDGVHARPRRALRADGAYAPNTRAVRDDSGHAQNPPAVRDDSGHSGNTLAWRRVRPRERGTAARAVAIVGALGAAGVLTAVIVSLPRHARISRAGRFTHARVSLRANVQASPTETRPLRRERAPERVSRARTRRARAGGRKLGAGAHPRASGWRRTAVYAGSWSQRRVARAPVLARAAAPHGEEFGFER